VAAIATALLSALGSSALASSPAPGSVYVTSANNTVSSYAIGSGGALKLEKASIALKARGVPYSIALSPNGRYAYIAEDDYAKSAGVIAQYSIAGGGALVADSTSTVKTGTGPIAIALSPNDRFAYVANEDAGTVTQYTVGSGGTLTGGHAISAGVAPDAIAISPNGRYVYIANQYAGKASQRLGGVSQFTVAAGGALTSDRVASVAAGSQPDAVVVAPNGRYVYVTNFRGSGGVSQYTIGAGGMLTADRTATVKTGNAPHGIVISPDGRHVYVATEDGAGGEKSTVGGVSQYTVGAGGMLAPDATPAVKAGAGPFSITMAPGGHYVYVANDSTRGAGGISQYTIGAGGMLVADRPPTVAGGDLPLAIVAAP
jgi:DNA-binding beta-propeller fold protein YncE